MAKKGKGVARGQRGGGTNYTIIQISRFTGRINIDEPWFKMTEPINIRLFYGGHFVTKKGKTTYEKGDSSYFGLSLHTNVEEVCFFEFVDWIKRELGYPRVGELWHRKRGYSLSAGRKQIKDDNDIPEFLEAKEKDGWYKLYHIHVEEVVDKSALRFGPGVTFYSDSEISSGTSGRHDSSIIGESTNSDSANFSDSTNNRESMVGQKKDALQKDSVDKEGGDDERQQNNPRSDNLQPLSLTQTTLLNPEQPHPTREKLQIISKAKKQFVNHCERSDLEDIPEDDELLGDGSDSEDSDVYLSEEDCEDQEDDDLFALNVDAGISERVINSLGGSREIYVEDQNLEEVEEGEEQEGEATTIEPDLDLNDSDGENVDLIVSDDENIDYPIFNPAVDFKHNINLQLGLKFPSNTVFRKALRNHAIENGYDYYYLHNTALRVTAYCAKRCMCPWKKGRIVECHCNSLRKCKFRIHCRKVKNEETFQIKSLNLEHVCGHQHVNTKVSSQYLAERYLQDFRDDPALKLDALAARATREVQVEISYWLVYNARKRALKMLFGDASVEYQKVWDYADAIVKYNPGSTTIVKVTGIEKPPPLFQRMYVCLQPCKQGFVAGCRRIIGVDGAHLRGQYPGILLTAVGKDGNNNIFPIAWAVVEVENSETWTWFLELLVKDLASVAGSVTWVNDRDADFTYMSDRQKGLLDAFSNVVPNAEIRFCCRHIWSNFKTKFPGEIYRESFWKAARSCTKHHFEQHMQKIKAINVEAFNYLDAIPTCNWSRHAFPTTSKSGMLLNNCCESFNHVLREARTKPIISLMEWMRRYAMKRCCAKREGLMNFKGMIMPSVVRMIEKGLLQVSSMTVSQADLHEFEVDDGEDTYVVNLQEKVCGCYRWSLMGIPCWHALACIVKRRLSYEEFVDPAYHVSTYTATYSPVFKGMPGYKQWERSSLPQPLPPPFKKMPGRPSKKKRVKEAGEDKERQLVKRAKKNNKCSNCGGLGHYYKKCTNPGVQLPKKKGGDHQRSLPQQQQQEPKPAKQLL